MTSPMTWQNELKASLTSVGDLLAADLILEAEAEQLARIGDAFKIRITPYYAKLMERRADCPIRLQAVPALGEVDPVLPEWAQDWSREVYAQTVPWVSDPIGDQLHLEVPRLTHRYRSRAILHFSSLCAVYCRFCFRKSHLNDEERPLYQGDVVPALEYLKKNSEIRELILTGGDPLSVPTLQLEKFLLELSKIPSIKTLRFHSRMLVTLPSRVDADLLGLLSRNWPFQLIWVSHFNHPRELTEEVRQASLSLKKLGILLLNQSVLLKGVNDSAEVLETLLASLYELGILPYYMHYPDWTPGTFHFRTGVERAKQLMLGLRGKVPGPALPRLMLDTPKGHGKVGLLEVGSQKILAEKSDREAGVGGRIYEISCEFGPQVRGQNSTAYRYLDLYPLPSDRPKAL